MVSRVWSFREVAVNGVLRGPITKLVDDEIFSISSIKGSYRFSDGQSAVACGSLSLDPFQTACCSIDRSLQWHYDVCNFYILTAKVTKSSRSSCALTNHLVFVPILYSQVILYAIYSSLIVIPFLFLQKDHNLLVPREGVTDLPYTHWHVHMPRTHAHAVIVGEVWEWAIEMSRHLFRTAVFQFFGSETGTETGCCCPNASVMSQSPSFYYYSGSRIFHNGKLIQIITAAHNGWRYLKSLCTGQQVWELKLNMYGA